jgi:hypothetical protein
VNVGAYTSDAARSRASISIFFKKLIARAATLRQTGDIAPTVVQIRRDNAT